MQEQDEAGGDSCFFAVRNVLMHAALPHCEHSVGDGGPPKLGKGGLSVSQPIEVPPPLKRTVALAPVQRLSSQLTCSATLYDSFEDFWLL